MPSGNNFSDLAENRLSKMLHLGKISVSYCY